MPSSWSFLFPFSRPSLSIENDEDRIPDQPQNQQRWKSIYYLSWKPKLRILNFHNYFSQSDYFWKTKTNSNQHIRLLNSHFWNWLLDLMIKIIRYRWPILVIESKGLGLAANSKVPFLLDFFWKHLGDIIFSPFEFPATDIYFVQSPPMVSPVVEFQAWALKLDKFFLKNFLRLRWSTWAPGSWDLSQAEKIIIVM